MLFIPRKSDECLEILAKNNICNIDRVDEINIFLIPIAQNLLSLEMHDSFAHSMNQDDDTYLIYVKESVKKLE